MVKRVLGALLLRHPGALIGALTGDASARVVAVPEGIEVDAQQPRFVGDTLSNQLHHEDRPLVSKLWTEARAAGLGSLIVHFEGSDEPTCLYFLDFREEHDVIVFVCAVGVDQVDATLVRPASGWRPVSRFSRIVKDSIATIVEVDEAFERMLGWSAEEVRGRRSLELIHPDDHDLAIEHWLQMLSYAGASRPVRLRQQHKDGRWLWIDVINHNRLEDIGDVIADMVDVTEEVVAQDAVRARQQLLEQVTESLPIGLLHADMDGRLLYANQRFGQITGLTVGDRLHEWMDGALPPHDRLVVEAIAAAGTGRPTDAVVDMVGRDGGIQHCSVSVRPLADSVGSINGITGSVEDVTAAVIERRELETRAATDSLTGCLNRSAAEALAQDALDALTTDSDGRDGVAVIFVDVDNLKEINDHRGHAAGDALLVELADRIHGAVRAHDTVGRFGGDEFVILLTNIRNAEHALTVARWVASRITKSFSIDGEPVELRASLGVAWTSAPGTEAAVLIEKADAAMYLSKREGRGEPVLGEPVGNREPVLTAAED